MEIKTQKLSENATIPTKAYFNDAGFDLYAAEDAMLYTLTPTLVSTDIAMEIPMGFYGRICDRSGMGSKGVHVLAGTIDASYRGNIKVVLVYLKADYKPAMGPLSYEIKKGDRIAQMIISPCLLPDLVEVDKLTPSDRGNNGWGSSGK